MDPKIKGMSIAAVAVTILAIATLLGVALINGFDDATKLDTAVDNETFVSAVNGTAKALANDEIVTGTDRVYNDTSQTTLLVRDTAYTIDYDTGKITIIDGINGATSLYVDYTYEADTEVSTSASNFVAGLQVFATFSGLVVLVLIAGIILRLIKSGKED